MNKRLLLALYDRSGLGAYMPVDYKGQELEVEEHWEKFAELIVIECAKHALDFNHNIQSLQDKVMRGNLDRVQDYIKDRMGLKND